MAAYGITPAYAGKSLFILRQNLSFRDHPRVCGEKKASPAMTGNPQGSPPRMRGKVLQNGVLAFEFGITPAYAGKSDKPASSTAQGQDHPRVCGEKWFSADIPATEPGSPPRMRGKEKKKHYVQFCMRITPAYAGKSFLTSSGSASNWDHPRVCGEKEDALPVFCTDSGSPPRMRGKVVTLEILGDNLGITPAYAGKSQGLNRLQSVVRDHPRVCGEKACACCKNCDVLGSPPRMRGKALLCRF